MDIKVIRTIDYRLDPTEKNHETGTDTAINVGNVKSFSFPNDHSIFFNCLNAETTVSMERVLMLLQDTKSITLEGQSIVNEQKGGYKLTKRFELYHTDRKPKEQWGKDGWGSLIKLSSRANPKIYMGDQVHPFWRKSNAVESMFIKVDAAFNVVYGQDGAVRVYANEDNFSGDAKKPILTIPPFFTECLKDYHDTSYEPVTGNMDIQSNGGVSGIIDFV